MCSKSTRSLHSRVTCFRVKNVTVSKSVVLKIFYSEVHTKYEYVCNISKIINDAKT